MEAPNIVADHLYGIEMRPQELALYGEQVDFQVRHCPIYDDPDEATAEHFQLLVLEVWTEVPPDHPAGREAGRLQLLKCGWELQLETPEPIPAGQVTGGEREIRHLLGRIAETVNELARRAGLEAPLGPALVDELIAQAAAASVHGPE